MHGWQKVNVTKRKSLVEKLKPCQRQVFFICVGDTIIIKKVLHTDSMCIKATFIIHLKKADWNDCTQDWSFHYSIIASVINEFISY